MTRAPIWKIIGGAPGIAFGYQMTELRADLDDATEREIAVHCYTMLR